MINTTIRNGTASPSFGIVVQPSGGLFAANKVRLTDVHVFAMTHTGLYMANGASATVSNSTFHHNLHGVAIQNGAGTVVALLDGVQIASNSGDGLRVLGVVTARLANTVITGSGTNGILFSGGTVESFGNNRIRGNIGNDGAGIIPVAQQ